MKNEEDSTMAGMSRLACNTAYDLDDMLTAVKGHGHMLMAHLPPGHPLRTHVDGIMEAAEHAAMLTRVLLELSRHVSDQEAGAEQQALPQQGSAGLGDAA